MDQKQKDFVLKMLSGCKNYDEWLVVIRFGLESLLQDRAFFLDLVEREARSWDGDLVTDMVTIFNDLGVHFAVTPA